MKQETIVSFGAVEVSERGFNLFERIIIQHAEPVKLLSHSLAGIWALYFAWQHQWERALAVTVVLGLFGVVFAWNSDPDELVQTPIGKWFFVMLNPINLLLQSAGYVVVFYGTWMHDTQVILLGVSAIIVGNMFGWDRLKNMTVIE